MHAARPQYKRFAPALNLLGSCLLTAFLFSTGLMIVTPVEGIAAEPEAISTLLMQSTVEPDSEPPPPAALEEMQKERQKNLLSISWLMWIGIILSGGLLVLIAVFLGSYTRKLVRRPAPRAELKNQFWYLKKRPTDPSDEQEAS